MRVTVEKRDYDVDVADAERWCTVLDEGGARVGRIRAGHDTAKRDAALARIAACDADVESGKPDDPAERHRADVAIANAERVVDVPVGWDDYIGHEPRGLTLQKVRDACPRA